MLPCWAARLLYRKLVFLSADSHNLLLGVSWEEDDWKLRGIISTFFLQKWGIHYYYWFYSIIRFYKCEIDSVHSALCSLFHICIFCRLSIIYPQVNTSLCGYRKHRKCPIFLRRYSMCYLRIFTFKPGNTEIHLLSSLIIKLLYWTFFHVNRQLLACFSSPPTSSSPSGTSLLRACGPGRRKFNWEILILKWVNK